MRLSLRLLVVAAATCVPLVAGVASALSATPSTAYEVSRVEAPDAQLRGRWGERVATVRDVNGDGINELLVGLPRFDVAAVTDAGRAYLVDGATRSVMYAVNPLEIQTGARFGFWISVLGVRALRSQPAHLLVGPGAAHVELLERIAITADAFGAT